MGVRRSIYAPGAGSFAPIASVPTVVTGGGTADSAAILAAFNTMKISGHASGTLKLKGTVALDAALTLDGGYTNVQGNWTSGSTERFVLDCSEASLVSAANVGAALTVKGFYGAKIDVRFKGGGSSRIVTDAAITVGQATLTSATAAFVSTDVGKVVRIKGAGTNGQAPHTARILSRTNGTTVVLDINAVTTVSGATCAIRDIGIHLENLVSAEIDCAGNNFAGLLLHIDSASNALSVTQSTIRSIKGLVCGQTLHMGARQGSFGAILDGWDDDCVDGSVLTNSSDVQLLHWESYAPSSQDVSLLLDTCNSMSSQAINLGDSASEALLKIVGGDVGYIGRVYATSAGTSRDGVLMVEVKSIVLGSVETANCAAGIHLKGCGTNGIVVKHHRTLTGDTVGVKIDTGPVTSTFQSVEIDGYWNYTGSQAILVNSGLTGRVKVKGQIDSTCNQTGGSAINLADCLSSAVVFDVSGLTALANNGTVAAAVHHTTPANLIGLDGVRLGNGPGLASGANPVGPEHFGLLAWSNPPSVLSASASVPQNGKTIFVMVPVPYDITVGHIAVYCYGSGVGLTNTFVGIYSSTGTKLAASADCSTALQGSGRQSIALASSVKLTGGFGKYVYVAILVNWATTAPVFPVTPAVVNSSYDNITGTGTTIHLAAFENTSRTALPSPWDPTNNVGAVNNVPHVQLLA